MVATRKAVANRENAKASTGPRTLAGKSIARLNARKHGLNTPVPEALMRATERDYGDLLKYVGASSQVDLLDLLNELANRTRLRERRADLMRAMVASDLRLAGPDTQRLGTILVQLRRLETYERKSQSRLATLLKNAES